MVKKQKNKDLSTQRGHILYAVVRERSGQVWYPVGKMFEDWGTDNRTASDYAIVLARKNGNYCFESLPPGIAAGSYLVIVFRQKGSKPSGADKPIGHVKKVDFTGVSKMVAYPEEIGATAICNLAISKLGKAAKGKMIVDYYEDSEIAALCRKEYPRSRNEVLMRWPGKEFRKYASLGPPLAKKDTVPKVLVRIVTGGLPPIRADNQKKIAKEVMAVSERWRGLTKQLISLPFRVHPCVVLVDSHGFGQEMKHHLIKQFKIECQICLARIHEFGRPFRLISPQERLNYYNDYKSWCGQLEGLLMLELFNGSILEGKQREITEAKRKLILRNEAMIQRTVDFFITVALQEKKKPAETGRDGKGGQSENWHNDDFTEVVWNGKQYKFNKPQQALSVGYLWKNKRAREKSIGEAIGSEAENFRLIHIFRQQGKKTKMHPAWGTMIVPDGKGIYALAECKKALKK